MTAQNTLGLRVARMVRRQPIILAWFGAFAVGASLNFTMGFQQWGFWTGFAFVCVAVVGAYCAHEFQNARGGKLVAQIAMSLFAFALGQWCGWQQLGLRMSKGLTTMTSQASGYNTASDQLAAAREERKKIGATRPVAVIEAEMALEERRTSRSCPDGKCGKWTTLKTELETAKRAVALDEKLPGMTKALSDSEQITDPNAMFAVPMAIGTVVGSYVRGRPVEVTPQDVMFYFSIFMTALIESIATFGPWLLGLKIKLADSGDDEDGFEKHDFGQRLLTSPAAVQRAFDGSAVSGAPGSQEAAALIGQRRDDGLHQPAQPPASGPAVAPGAPASASGGMGGAITLNLYGPQGQPAATPLVPVVTPADKQADDNVALLRSVPPRLQITRNDPPAPAAPDAPTDRSALNAMLDSFVIFRAACVVDQPGTWLDATDLYAAYVDWAGARAQTAATFHTLFPATTSVPLHHVAGEMKYAGIGIKGARVEQARA